MIVYIGTGRSNHNGDNVIPIPLFSGCPVGNKVCYQEAVEVLRVASKNSKEFRNLLRFVITLLSPSVDSLYFRDVCLYPKNSEARCALVNLPAAYG